MHMIHSHSKTPLNRIWFLARGYRKHPCYNLWAHEGCAWFVSAYGQRLMHIYSPYSRKKQTKRGYYAPCMRQFGSRTCHTLMGEIFYGERPTFINSTGKPYVGICHHLINDLLDYSPDNLLCWLTRAEHTKADKRRRLLESVVPNGNLRVFTYARLRYLQDPRILSDDDFEKELAAIRQKGYHLIDPAERMEYDMTHHMEC